MGSPLIWLSGARPDILAQCEVERPKYQVIGMAVLATSPMSAFSMAVTLHAVSGMRFPAAIPLALAWGLVVMSLNRWLVVSLVRQSPWRCIMAALPRLLLGLLLATITSVPLVLGLFHSDIAFQIWHDHARNAATYSSSPAAASLGMSDFGTSGKGLGILVSLKALDELGRQYGFAKELAIAILVLFTLIQWAPVVDKTLLNLSSKSAYETLLDVAKLYRELHPADPRAIETVRMARWMVAMAVLVLAPADRPRYREEFQAESADIVGRLAKLRYAASLLASAWPLRAQLRSQRRRALP